MNKSKDRFSEGASDYKQFRPEYPEAFYTCLLSLVPNRARALDAGTGNGQVANVLAQSFREVDAIDISAEQIAQAPAIPNVRYHIGRVENADFPSDAFDLLTVAQAYHWFDFEAFASQAKRILKPDGLVAVWGYGLLQINSEVDRLIADFYEGTIGPYWDAERKHIDSAYGTVGFDFREIKAPESFHIETEWGLDELMGYLGTWSGVKRYKKAEQADPLPQLARSLRKVWPSPSRQKVRFPIFLRLGKR